MTSVRLPREIVHERSVHEKPFTVGQSGSKHPDAPARLLRSHTRALTALARQRDTMQAQGVSHEVMLTTFGSRLIASRNSRPPAAGFGQCPGCTRAHLSAGACVATDQVVTRSDLSFRYRILQYACGLLDESAQARPSPLHPHASARGRATLPHQSLPASPSTDATGYHNPTSRVARATHSTAKGAVAHVPTRTGNIRRGETLTSRLQV